MTLRQCDECGEMWWADIDREIGEAWWTNSARDICNACLSAATTSFDDEGDYDEVD